METVLAVVTVGRDQLLWAKMSITLEMVSMAMVPMHQNTDYIKMVSMAVAMGMVSNNQSLATIALVLIQIIRIQEYKFQHIIVHNFITKKYPLTMQLSVTHLSLYVAMLHIMYTQKIWAENFYANDGYISPMIRGEYNYTLCSHYDNPNL